MSGVEVTVTLRDVSLPFGPFIFNFSSILFRQFFIADPKYNSRPLLSSTFVLRHILVDGAVNFMQLLQPCSDMCHCVYVSASLAVGVCVCVCMCMCSALAVGILYTLLFIYALILSLHTSSAIIFSSTTSRFISLSLSLVLFLLSSLLINKLDYWFRKPTGKRIDRDTGRKTEWRQRDRERETPTPLTFSGVASACINPLPNVRLTRRSDFEPTATWKTTSIIWHIICIVWSTITCIYTREIP